MDFWSDQTLHENFMTPTNFVIDWSAVFSDFVVTWAYEPMFTFDEVYNNAAYKIDETAVKMTKIPLYFYATECMTYIRNNQTVHSFMAHFNLIKLCVVRLCFKEWYVEVFYFLECGECLSNAYQAARPSFSQPFCQLQLEVP